MLKGERRTWREPGEEHVLRRYLPKQNQQKQEKVTFSNLRNRNSLLTISKIVPQREQRHDERGDSNELNTQHTFTNIHTNTNTLANREGRQHRRKNQPSSFIANCRTTRDGELLAGELKKKTQNNR